jgi:NAD(P)-dependent dehydrogenase (short-subunit alcohol dehydrogenase family)
MQSVFVSGSATGIGAGLVNKLLHEGWQVFAGYRNSPPESASWYGHPQAVPLKCDVTSVPDFEAAARQVASKTGYFGSGGVVESTDMDEYRKLLPAQQVENIWTRMFRIKQ